MTSYASMLPARDAGRIALFALPILAFAVALFDYFWTGNGIHGSAGALLVVVSTLLMILAATLIVTNRLAGPWLVVFDVLLGLDFLSTAVAAYFLESWLLLGLVLLAAIAWLVHIFRLTPGPAEVQS